MVILINFTPKPLKVEYKSGSKTFMKQLPPNKIVAMKGLNTFNQISNRNFLATHNDVTMLNYESNAFFFRHPSTPTGATSMQFSFIGNNVKPSGIVNFAATGITTGYARLKTMM